LADALVRVDRAGDALPPQVLRQGRGVGQASRRSSVSARASRWSCTTRGVIRTSSSVRALVLFWLPSSAPSTGTSLRKGTPWLPREELSRIRPASPIVCPSCTTIRERTARSRKVGELMPKLGALGSTSLTCCEMSRVTRPPLLTRGITSVMTPVSR
jgi:hypothetical protein